MEHVFKILNTLLVEESLPFCILSPQHLSQEHCKSKMDTMKSGTRAVVREDEVELQWANCWFKKTITIQEKQHQSSPGVSKYKSFAAKINTEDKQIACFDVHIISDNESFAPVNNDKDNLSEAEEGNQNPSATTIALNPTDEERLAEPNIIETFEEFEAGLPCQDYEQVESELDNPIHELLHWHYKLGHESFRHLPWMARSGILPKRLANCQAPQCVACYCRKASRRPWREKGLANQCKIALATAPGQIVSVDQMQSTVPGMVGQIKGIPTRQQYHYVTVFVDQFSGLSFVHLQKTSSGEEMLDAKMAFEGFVHSLNVQIQHYHANNRHFCENLWMSNVRKEGQTICFCSVNAHFQNRVAERQIRDLSDGARTSLLHEKEQWSKAISVHLWPYAVQPRNEVYNAI
jgi:hypothetical protein